MIRMDRRSINNGKKTVNTNKNSYELLESYNKLLEKFGNLKSGSMAARLLIKIGDIHKSLTDYGKARENYSLALKLFNDEEDTWGEAFTLRSIGNIWKMERIYSEARKYYQQSLKKFQKVGNLEMEKNILRLISGCYQAEGAIEEAIDIHTKISELPLNSAQFFINQINIKRLINEINSIRPTKIQSSILICYILILIFSEVVTTYDLTSWGIILQVILITCLVINSTLTRSTKFSYLLQAMILLPIIRIMSLSIPVMELEPLYWLALMAIPVIAAIWILMQSQHINKEMVGLNFGNLPLQVLVGLTGIGFGFVEYLILQPTALIPNLELWNILLASSMVIISTGLVEELVFRGIIQRNAENLMGKLWGIIFTAVLFTGFNISWNSPIDVIFIFAVSICYGYVFQKTRSVVGISISHGLGNVVLFIIMPFFL